MLNYLKVNDYNFVFQKGLNIINIDDSIKLGTDGEIEEGNGHANNLGKTTLVSIISRIHGQGLGHLPMTQEVINKARDLKKEINVEWEFEVNEISYKFLYNTRKNEEIIFYLNKNTSLTKSEYRDFIRKVLHNEIFVVNETHCIDTKFILESKSSSGFNSFFPNKSATYLALMLTLLLNDENTFQIDETDEKTEIDEINGYFKQVAKRNSYRNLKSRYHAEMLQKIKENSEEKDLYKKYYDLEQEKKKLKKLSEDKIDKNILVELEKLELPVNIEDVKNFHIDLIEDYNSLVELKIKEIDVKLEDIKVNMFDGELSEYEPFEISMGSQINKYIDELSDLLRKENKQVNNLLDKFLTIANVKLSEFNKGITQIFEKEKNVVAKNRLKKGRYSEEILETLSFKDEIQNAGDGYRQINDALLFANLLEETRLNIVVLDTMKTSEISDHFEDMLNGIKSIVTNKQYIIITFKEVDKKKFNVCKQFKEPLFGFEF